MASKTIINLQINHHKEQSLFHLQTILAYWRENNNQNDSETNQEFVNSIPTCKVGLYHAYLSWV